MKKVVVTGANGHVGYSITKLLVERGYEVRATVRDASDSTKTAHLKALGVDVEDGVIRASMVHYNNLYDVEKLIKLINSLEDNEDVQTVSSNFEISEEIMNQLTK